MQVFSWLVVKLIVVVLILGLGHVAVYTSVKV
jgi:hypothetical protein